MNRRQLDAVSVLHVRIRPSDIGITPCGVEGGLNGIASGHGRTRGRFGRISGAKIAAHALDVFEQGAGGQIREGGLLSGVSEMGQSALR